MSTISILHGLDNSSQHVWVAEVSLISVCATFAFVASSPAARKASGWSWRVESVVSGSARRTCRVSGIHDRNRRRFGRDSGQSRNRGSRSVEGTLRNFPARDISIRVVFVRRNSIGGGSCAVAFRRGTKVV